MMRKSFLGLIGLFVCIQTTQAQSMTAAEVFQNMKRQFELIKDYVATLKVTVDMEKTQIPEMLVTIYFKQPDKVHIESKNFAMIPREVADVNPIQLMDKFDATAVGTEQKDNVTYYKLRLMSKPEKGRPVRESYALVDGSRWVVTHFETAPSEMRKVLVDLDYMMVDHKYILPKKVDVRLETQEPSDSSAERMYGQQRTPRKGTVTVQYSDYKVNTGLSDEIFEKKKEKQ
ncbi:MAG TPA: hypothetical protein VMM58_09895 [Bacteroidota bacterium]|nr:hypothetical protein [Bacteroidota bacterium]